MTQLDGIPAAGLANATVPDLEERVLFLERDLKDAADTDSRRARVLRGALQRTRDELDRRGVKG